MSIMEQIESLLKNTKFVINFHIQFQSFHNSFKYNGKYKIQMWVKKDLMDSVDVMQKIMEELTFEEQIRAIAQKGSYSVEFDIYGV